MDFRFSIFDLRLKRRKDASRARVQSAIGNRQSQIVRLGFSFTEVLFAVAVLGIGFIMVAAIFPPAIQQTQFAVEQTYGTTVARNGMNLLQASAMFRNDVAATAIPPAPAQTFVPITLAQRPVGGTIPPGAIVMSFRDPRMQLFTPYAAYQSIASVQKDLWNSIRGSLIDASDSRFAIIPMYSRDNGAAFIHLIAVAVRIRNSDQFKLDRDAPNLAAPATSDKPIVLDPVPVTVTLKWNEPTGPNTMTIAQVQTSDNKDGVPATSFSAFAGLSNVNAACEGAYVIISDDEVTTASGNPFVNLQGQANGRIYHLGRQDSATTWEIAPDMDMRSSSDQLTGAIAFVVGAGRVPGTYPPYSDPSGPGGANTAVQVYDSLIPLK